MTRKNHDRARPRGLRPALPLPQTAIEMNGEALASILGLVTSTVTVSERTVRGIPAIDAGVTMIANAVAAMMTDAKVRDATGLEVAVPPIVARPNALLGSSEFWVQLVTTVMMRGNYVAILADHDLDGWPRQVVPVHPDAVTLDAVTGFPFYRVGNAVFGPDEIVHIRHGADVGSFWGQGIVERFRKALSAQLHEQNYGEKSYSSGGVPSAVISLDAPKVPTEVAEQVQADWIETHGGTRKPAVIPRSMSVTPLSWSPKDAEFVQSQQLSVAEAALMCGLDPADLGAAIGGQGMTYANLTDRQLSRLVQSFSPWLRLVEEAWTDLLPGANTTEGDPEALLRTSTLERLNIRKVSQEIGIETPEESRVLEGRPPAPATTPNGDPNA